ncbi:MAG: SUMF1/EgtB/PvdO family nonheme iron enzyme [Anaerolineae bacterium]
MGVSDKVPLRLPLVEMYVPLKARIELPEGETWTRQLRLAGRAVSPAEVEAIGQRLSEPQPVLELLQQQPGLIILGDPGAGKTTFLKYLALQLATGQGEILHLGNRLPILLPLSAYANALAEKDIPLDRFIPTYYRDRGVDLPLGPMLNEALEQGGALLLLDGLDEVKEQGQRGLVVERVLDFFGLQQQRGNKFILTSRIVGYREVRPSHPGLAECTLVDFEAEEISQFISQWTGALERAARGDTPVAAQEALREASELLAATERNPGVQRLAANPLLLTILALMKRQGVTLPERRVELYQKYVETLLKTWNLARGLGRPATRDLDVVETLKVLAPLALWMHQTSPGIGLVKREAMRQELERIYTVRADPAPDKAARQFLADVREHASLLLERGAGEFGFIHLTFQEYLAAVALAQQGQSDIKPVAAALAAHLEDETWREVSLLTVGYIGIIQQRDQAAGELAWQLTQCSALGAILAGEAICDAGPGGVTAQSRAKVVNILLQVIRAERQVEPKTRAVAGIVLGRLGDPREGVTSLPPLLTPVLEGEFLYGEKKQRRTVAPFRAGVYLVTNAQFAHFIQAGGYGQPGWWSEEGWQWRQQEDWSQPRWWSDPELNNPNQPVVGVSWYEAEAFCHWLSETYGQPYHLPTEAEWERLARGQDGREYPWGDKWQEGLANTNEAGIRQPSAVGLFPSGVSPAGVYDCAGNVWEWCADWYDKERTGRVLRGGFFFSYEEYARCAVRLGNLPYGWGRNNGFRVVVSPIL